MEDTPSSFSEWLSLSIPTGLNSPPPMPPAQTNDIPVPVETHVTPSPYPVIHQEPSICVAESSPPPIYRGSSQTQRQPASTSGQHLSGRSRPARSRRSPAQTFKQAGKRNTIVPPYPWATSRRAHVHSFEYLMSKGINKISGEVKCKRCEKKYEIEYDLEERFLSLANFIVKNKYSMHDRAPSVWKSPSPIDCKLCGGQNCVMPTTSKKRSINWLFLLLGQTIGCCKLFDLKYFCKHTKTHRTGAKDRLLYLTYLGLCKQLDPRGPFDL